MSRSVHRLRALYQHYIALSALSATTSGLALYMSRDFAGHSLLHPVFLGLLAAVTAGVLHFGKRILGVVAAEKQREADLAELRRLNAIFENALGGFATVDATVDGTGRYRYVNAAYAEILGAKPEEMLGRPAGGAVYEADERLYTWSVAKSASEGRAEAELRIVRKDGSLACAHVVFVDGDGERFIFTKDITAEKLAVQALRVSEERLELAARATNDVIWEWDLVRHRLWISDALPQRIGVPLSGGDVDGDLWIDVIHPDDRERAVCNATVAIDSGIEHWTEEYRVRRADGTYAHVFDRAFIVRDELGVARRMIGAMVDVSARKASEESIARLVRHNEMILGSIAEGIFGVDLNGRLTFINESGASLLGWTPVELIGQEFHPLVHHSHEDGSPYPVEECPSRHALDVGASPSYTTTHEYFWRKDGTGLAVEYAARPMRDANGTLVGAVVTFRDITERRAVERMKDEFVSVVSHELRTPLTSIRGALGLLAGGRVGELPERASRMIDIAVSNTDRLVRLINDILDIERMESGRITLARQFCDAGDLIDEAVEGMRPLAARAGIELEGLPCSTTIFADPDRIVQTITNLVSNAIKFSDPSTRILVTASLVEGTVQFEVQDEGRGIPASKLETIFERFQQVDASDSREKGGSGLGLAICRSVVRQHGGEIWCESEVGRGSRFLFTVPRANVVAADRTLLGALERAIEGKGRRARVLLVEDDADLARIITESFQRLGIEIVHARTGEEGIELAQRHTPDLLVLDLILPGVDGFGVVDWLKERALLPSVPLVVYSAVETTPAQRERLTLGPTEFLTKSRVSPDEFERRVVQLLGAVVTYPGEMSNVA